MSFDDLSGHGVENVDCAGLEVRALLRDPSRMPEELRKQVEVFTGDVLVKDDVDKVVEGRDAIVVTLGTRNDLGKIIFNQIMFHRLCLCIRIVMKFLL